MREAAAGQDRLFAGNRENLNRTLQLTVSVVVGQPIRVHYLGSSVGDRGLGWALVSRIRFDGLPPGSRITSCHGFEQDMPVPALRSSWGTVKSDLPLSG